jgi:hypothetical protein
MPNPLPTPTVLRLESPFYDLPVNSTETNEAGTSFLADKLMDDAWAETINAALRLSAEARFEPFELRR